MKWGKKLIVNFVLSKGEKLYTKNNKECRSIFPLTNFSLKIFIAMLMDESLIQSINDILSFLLSAAKRNGRVGKKTL